MTSGLRVSGRDNCQTPRMPRRSLGVLAALAVCLSSAPAHASPLVGQVAEPAPVLLIEGRGFGHGVGMAQDGAYALAVAGASAADILQRFYPGTSMGQRSGTVQVDLLDSPGPIVIALPGGGEIRSGGTQAPGFPVSVSPGGSVALAFSGGTYRVRPVSGASIAPVAAPAAPAQPNPRPGSPAVTPATPPTTAGLLSPLFNALAPSTASGPMPTTARSAPTPAPAPSAAAQIEAVSPQALSVVPKGDSVVSLQTEGRRYRGTVQVTSGGGGLRLTNVVDVELYLRGLGEVPASWPAAALQAQAIAARTVAMETVASGRRLCDDQQCQVYVGAGNEDPATTAAAIATRGKVLTFGGSLAEAVYSASGGGVSASAEEGFGPGSPDPSYLQPVMYPTADPQPWAVSIPLPQLASRFGYRGELTGARVSRAGPSGRALDVTLDGSNGPMVVDGRRFWRTLDLRSTLYVLRLQGPGAPGAEPLNALIDGLSPVRSAPGRVLVAALPRSLGRAPWIGAATLLLAAWALSAQRFAKGRRRRRAGSASC